MPREYGKWIMGILSENCNIDAGLWFGWNVRGQSFLHQGLWPLVRSIRHHHFLMVSHEFHSPSDDGGASGAKKN